MRMTTQTGLTGKVRTPLKNRGDATKPNYSVGLMTMEKWYDRTNKKTVMVPTTVFVNIVGDVPDFIRDYLSKEGNPVAVLGAFDYECVVATNQDGSPMKHSKGERQGEFMYNISMRAPVSAFDVPSKSDSVNPPGIPVTASATNTPVPARANTGGDTDEAAWLR